MKVLSYDPSDDLFFVAVTWDEYRQLAAKYEIDTGSKDVGVEDVIEIYQYHHEEQEDVDDESERVSYEQYIKNLYGIDDMPNICLIIKRDLSDFAVEQYDHPFHHMWNGYSPWEKIETVSINDLDDLAALECIEKGRSRCPAGERGLTMTEKVTLVRQDGLPMPLINFAAPEDLVAWYAGNLLYSLEKGERDLAISCFDVGTVFSFDLAKTAQLVLRAVTDVLYDHPEAERLEIFCDGEAAWQAYNFCWNLWYAETKPPHEH